MTKPTCMDVLWAAAVWTFWTGSVRTTIKPERQCSIIGVDARTNKGTGWRIDRRQGKTAQAQAVVATHVAAVPPKESSPLMSAMPEKFKDFIARYVFHPLEGMTLGNWWALLTSAPLRHRQTALAPCISPNGRQRLQLGQRSD